VYPAWPSGDPRRIRRRRLLLCVRWLRPRGGRGPPAVDDGPRRGLEGPLDRLLASVSAYIRRFDAGSGDWAGRILPASARVSGLGGGCGFGSTCCTCDSCSSRGLGGPRGFGGSCSPSCWWSVAWACSRGGWRTGVLLPAGTWPGRFRWCSGVTASPTRSPAPRRQRSRRQPGEQRWLDPVPPSPDSFGPSGRWPLPSPRPRSRS
jgi:hypothetical protein